MRFRAAVVMSTALAVACGGVVSGFGLASASATPYKCIEIQDPNGNPIKTVCIPLP